MFRLVFKRGGDTPEEFESDHRSRQDAVREATREYRRQRAAGWKHVWLAYDVWEVPPRGRMKRVMRDVVLQRPS
jgi:hypothetical protein